MQLQTPEVALKRDYKKPEILRIDIQDRNMLGMAICKAETPLVDNCCTLGSGCPSDPSGEGGGPGAPLGTPIMDLSDS